MYRLQGGSHSGFHGEIILGKMTLSNEIRREKSKSLGGRSRGEATGHGRVSEFQSGWSPGHRMDGGLLREAKLRNSDWHRSRIDLLKSEKIRGLFVSLLLSCW